MTTFETKNTNGLERSNEKIQEKISKAKICYFWSKQVGRCKKQIFFFNFRSKLEGNRSIVNHEISQRSSQSKKQQTANSID